MSRISIWELRRRAAEYPDIEMQMFYPNATVLALVETVEAAARARQWGYVTQELADALAQFDDLPYVPSRARLDEIAAKHMSPARPEGNRG